MLSQDKVFDTLKKNGVNFFVGVPDSYLNGFCNYALENSKNNNIIAANEGNAVCIAAGHFFATKEIPLVYLQNSGMGITINPLVSLVDRNVYAVPMLLLVGWRGQEESEPNHPQHKLQGEITPRTFELLHIPYTILSDDDKMFSETIKMAVAYCNETRQPYGLIAPQGVMAQADKKNIEDFAYSMNRENAIEVILDHMPKDTIYSATTGRTTRELFYLRKKRNETGVHDFLNVGAMGHVSSVALGMALGKPNRMFVVLDGDGSTIMHMGAMTMASTMDIPNYLHVVLNNGAHESVGGQPSAGHKVNFTKIANACGYATIGKAVETEHELIDAIDKLAGCGRAAFIDCHIRKGLASKLPAIIFDHKAAIDLLMDELND